MPRQTITLTDPNYAWLQARVDSGEFRTQTEAVNDALRRVRQKEDELAFLQERLAHAREHGGSVVTREDILERSKAELRKNGAL